jgi:hypothetical protein
MLRPKLPTMTAPLRRAWPWPRTTKPPTIITSIRAVPTVASAV